MSTYNFDGTVSVNSDTLDTSSSDYRTIGIAGDTLRVVTPRAPTTSNSTGNTGEICWGSETVDSVTTYYIYVCVSTDTWKRVALAGPW
jgi:hypothetical protein